jgi:hypothetical protein
MLLPVPGMRQEQSAILPCGSHKVIPQFSWIMSCLFLFGKKIPQNTIEEDLKGRADIS